MAKNKNRKYEIHDFYCTCCGKKGLVLPRSASKQRENGHLKRLYCIYCQKVVNHMEIKSAEDKALFLKMYESGDNQWEH